MKGTTTTEGPYTAGDLVGTATWRLNPTTGVLEDGFRDENGDPADPSSVELKWRTPDGQTHTATFPAPPIVRSPTTQGVSQGLFQAAFDTTGLPGTWAGQWMAPSGDPVQSIQPWSFVVNPAPVS